MASALKVKASNVLQGSGIIDVGRAMTTVAGPSTQSYPYSSGQGSLETARGAVHVVDPATGQALTGERDIFGQVWNPATWAPAALRADARGADIRTVTSAAPLVGRRRTNGSVSARLSPATRRVRGLSIVLLGLATVVFRFWVDNTSLPGALHAPWWALALGFGAAEVFVIHLEFRRDTHSISLSEIPIVMGLFFGSPAALIEIGRASCRERVR